MVKYQENGTARFFFPHLWFSSSGFLGGHATKQYLTLWITILQIYGSQLHVSTPFFCFSACQRRTRSISQPVEEETRKESTKSSSPGQRQDSVLVVCSRLPQLHKVAAFLHRQVCYRFRCNTEKNKCLRVAELTTTLESEVKMYGYDSLELCLSPKVSLSVSVWTHCLTNEHSSLVLTIMLPCPKAASECPEFVCGSLSPKFILQADPRDIQMVPYISKLTLSLPFWYIVCIPYCLKNNDGRMSALRHLVCMCSGRWYFLLTTWEAERSPDQPQSFCYPQVRVDKRTPYCDRDRRILSGRNMNQMLSFGIPLQKGDAISSPLCSVAWVGRRFIISRASTGTSCLHAVSKQGDYMSVRLKVSGEKREISRKVKHIQMTKDRSCILRESYASVIKNSGRWGGRGVSKSYPHTAHHQHHSVLPPSFSSSYKALTHL